MCDDVCTWIMCTNVMIHEKSVFVLKWFYNEFWYFNDNDVLDDFSLFRLNELFGFSGFLS